MLLFDLSQTKTLKFFLNIHGLLEFKYFQVTYSEKSVWKLNVFFIWNCTKTLTTSDMKIRIPFG